MALTATRIGALALLAAATAVTFLLPPEPRRLERGDPYAQAAARQAEFALQSARQAIAVRIIRDSARAAAGQNVDLGIPSLFVGPWRPGEREWLTARVRDIQDGAPGTGRAAVAFVRDSTLAVYPSLYYALPSEAGGACIAIYAENPGYAGIGRARYRRAGPALLGPCAYYARFGPAGHAVDAWLRKGGVALALTSPGYPPPHNRPPSTDGHSWVLAALSGQLSWWLVDQRLAFPLAQNACLAGRDASCADFVTGTRAGNRALRALGVHSEVLWAVEADRTTFLSDVLTAIGPDRFTTFWHADGTLEEAFATVVGSDLAAWTRDWTRELLGDRPRRPSVTLGALGGSMGVVALFVGFAVLVAARRRVL